jgi:hypothetical protein
MPAVNDVGKPCAGEPHARIDGRELETEHPGHGREEEQLSGKPFRSQWLRDLQPGSATAPALDPTSDVVGDVLSTSGAGG